MDRKVRSRIWKGESRSAVGPADGLGDVGAAGEARGCALASAHRLDSPCTRPRPFPTCPPWCQQSAGHLRPEPAGPSDSHTAEIAVIDLPTIPWLRDKSSIMVGSSSMSPPQGCTADLPRLRRRPEGVSVTTDEAARLAGFLQTAVALVSTPPSTASQVDDAAE
jgi:hypothetical protein